jgi:hypothetical protein
MGDSHLQLSPTDEAKLSNCITIDDLSTLDVCRPSLVTITIFGAPGIYLHDEENAVSRRISLGR